MDKSNNTKVIFFGTAEFAIPVLEALFKVGYDIVAVVTQPDKPVGRKQVSAPPPVKVAAQKLNLLVLQPEKLKNNLELVEQLKKLLNADASTPNANMGVVAAYGKLIPPEIFNLPEFGTLVIHPSLLPRYRGPSPVQGAILNGEKTSGVTIMKIDEETDHGPIISSAEYRIPADDSFSKINEEIWRLGADLLIKTLPDYLSGEIQPIPQDHSRATFTKKLTSADGEISSDDSAEQAYNKIRAFNPEPGAHYFFKKNSGAIRLKILEADSPYQKADFSVERGILKDGNNLILRLKNGYIVLRKVQPEGKKPMAGQEFARGLSR